MAILVATSLVPGACGAGERTGNAAAAGDGNIVATRPGDSAPAREPDARAGPAMTQERIVISSDRGRLTAELVDNDATRALRRMLPLTIEMRDHLRQEKTGTLPSPLPELQRQTEFSAGTLGLWGNDDFVIYYRNGHVPEPGIIVLGRVTGDLSVFDRPGAITVRIEHGG
ncbi:cyclophilin-like fold protein [Sphingomonas sp. DT-207]|uniref:cyclophilin-like fold protein n=1 Tax=Sphingomonas sp. DT-207 TaxID=3396167 RepID=UPI003F1CE0A8